MSAKDPALAGLIRQEQDLAKQINAQLGALHNALSLPAEQRDEFVVKAINPAIARARVEHDKARAEIGRRFPKLRRSRRSQTAHRGKRESDAARGRGAVGASCGPCRRADR